MARLTLVTVHERVDNTSVYRALHADDDGSLVVEGQDLGQGVGDFWGAGFTEYEFERRLDHAALMRVRAVLGVDESEPILAVLAARLGPLREVTTRLEQLVSDNDIESHFWSRVGD